jgi:hypothetical protein
MTVLSRGNNSEFAAFDLSLAGRRVGSFRRFSDGRRIAPQSPVTWFPLIVHLVAVVVIAYQLSLRGRITVRGIVAFALAAGGVMAFLDGFMIGVAEDGRTRYGRVSSGAVVEKFSSSGAQGTRRIGSMGGSDQQHTPSIVTGQGFAFYDRLARLIATGSAEAWAVDYRFPCGGGRTCFDRDLVTKEEWLRLRAGSTVNVRQADWETTTSRIDGHPRWATAFAGLGIGGLLLAAAGLVSGRLVLFRRRRWLTAPAVVLAVEPLRYGDVTQWRIRFAYFDRDGQAQESADQVTRGSWKTGDSCIAVYRPGQSNLATLQPVPAQSA